MLLFSWRGRSRRGSRAASQFNVARLLVGVALANIILFLFLVGDVLLGLALIGFGASKFFLLHIRGGPAAFRGRLDTTLDFLLAVGRVLVHDSQLIDLAVRLREVAVAPQVDFARVCVGV